MPAEQTAAQGQPVLDNSRPRLAGDANAPKALPSTISLQIGDVYVDAETILGPEAAVASAGASHGRAMAMCLC